VRRLLAPRQTILRAAITRYASRCIIASRYVFFVVSLLITVPHLSLRLGSSRSSCCSRTSCFRRTERGRGRERAGDVSSGQVVVSLAQPPLVIFRRMGTRKNGAFSRPPTSRCDEGIDQSSRASTLVILGASRVTRMHARCFYREYRNGSIRTSDNVSNQEKYLANDPITDRFDEIKDCCLCSFLFSSNKLCYSTPQVCVLTSCTRARDRIYFLFYMTHGRALRDIHRNQCTHAGGKRTGRHAHVYITSVYP